VGAVHLVFCVLVLDASSVSGDGREEQLGRVSLPSAAKK
jgi:hypothetical protein